MKTSKVLKALKTIIMYCDEEMVKDEIKIVKTALKEKEEIEIQNECYRYSMRLVKYTFCGYDFTLEELANILKTIDIIKDCFNFNGFDELIPNNKWFESEEKQNLLRKVLKK